MANRTFDQKNEITIRDLYPDLNEEQLKEAEDNLERYLDLVLRIYERIVNDQHDYSAFRTLTAGLRSYYDIGQKVESRL